jgi:thymidylate synthase ThyX
MTISAKIIADSVSPDGKRLTTVQTRYPKFIHGEVMTHRAFSRNASSSRAIPVARLIQDVIDDPIEPSFWGKNQPGMQAAEELTGEYLNMAKAYWNIVRSMSISSARYLTIYGTHKQIVNRILEPYCHINTLISATEWDNFFELRCHPAAQPEMRMLAEAIRDARAASTPKLLRLGEWHLPYFDPEADREALFDANLGGDLFDWMIRLSVARCARVSYLTQEGAVPTTEADLALYDRLVGSVPLHASPAEHQATPDRKWELGWEAPELHGNFVGWVQRRKQIEQRIAK